MKLSTISGYWGWWTMVCEIFVQMDKGVNTCGSVHIKSYSLEISIQSVYNIIICVSILEKGIMYRYSYKNHWLLSNVEITSNTTALGRRNDLRNHRHFHCILLSDFDKHSTSVDFSIFTYAWSWIRGLSVAVVGGNRFRFSDNNSGNIHNHNAHVSA